MLASIEVTSLVQNDLDCTAESGSGYELPRQLRRHASCATSTLGTCVCLDARLCAWPGEAERAVRAHLGADGPAPTGTKSRRTRARNSGTRAARLGCQCLGRELCGSAFGRRSATSCCSGRARSRSAARAQSSARATAHVRCTATRALNCPCAWHHRVRVAPPRAALHCVHKCHVRVALPRASGSATCASTCHAHATCALHCRGCERCTVT